MVISFYIDESVATPSTHGQVFGGVLWPTSFGYGNVISFYNNNLYKSGYGIIGNGISIYS